MTIIYRFFHIRGWRALVKECSKKRNKWQSDFPIHVLSDIQQTNISRYIYTIFLGKCRKNNSSLVNGVSYLVAWILNRVCNILPVFMPLYETFNKLQPGVQWLTKISLRNLPIWCTCWIYSHLLNLIFVLFFVLLYRIIYFQPKRSGYGYSTPNSFIMMSCFRELYGLMTLYIIHMLPGCQLGEPLRMPR